MCRATPIIVNREIRVYFGEKLDGNQRVVTWVASEMSSRRLWATCPEHGRQIPKHDRRKGLAWPKCPICEADAPMTAIEIRKPAMGKKPSRCGGACLAGQRSCDCKCQGRCHGAGKCSCG